MQKWEIAGIPATMAFYVAYRLGWLALIKVEEDQIPDLMVMVFLLMALVRAGVDYYTKRKKDASS
jgi:hypothetical protein